jgi:F0F1-type ATP synthase assembly protein I
MTGLMLGLGLGMAVVVRRADQLEKRGKRAKAGSSAESPGQSSEESSIE